MTKTPYIFLIIAVLLVLGGNLALGGYFQNPDNSRIKRSEIRPYLAQEALLSARRSFTGRVDEAVEQKDKTYKDVLMPEDQLNHIRTALSECAEMGFCGR